MRVSLIFVLCMTILPIYHILVNEAAAQSDVECVSWRMDSQERTRDNGIVTSYELICSRNGMKLSDIELVFVSVRRGENNGEIVEAYTKELYEVNGAYRVDIYSGRYERIVLLAKTRVGEKQFYAKALLNGFGESGKIDPEATRIEVVHNWPQLYLSGEEYYYYVQTGTPLNIHIENAAQIKEPQVMHIIENNTPTGARMSEDGGFYTYTPPHDETLSQTGYSAKNDLVFVVELENGSSAVSLYLPVHRAYYGQISLNGGLAVIAASALFCFVSVLYYGRRFRWN